MENHYKEIAVSRDHLEAAHKAHDEACAAHEAHRDAMHYESENERFMMKLHEERDDLLAAIAKSHIALSHAFEDHLRMTHGKKSVV